MDAAGGIVALDDWSSAVTWRTTVFDGLDQAPAARAAVLAGTTTGKGIVRV